MRNTVIYALLALLCLAGCQKPEYNLVTDGEDSQNVMTLTVKGLVGTDRMTEYPATVDEQNGVITLSLPYYLSNTEPIMPDITKIRLTASLPLGATFNPPLSGYKDLTDGFKSILTYADGTRKEYTFVVDLVKSDAAVLLDVVLEDPDIIYSIVHPSEGKQGTLTLPLDDDTRPYLEKARPKVSAWATFESDAYDPATGLVDLTVGGALRVVSQSGKVTSVYQIVHEVPEHLEGLRKVKPLFAFQPTQADAHGMVLDANRSMAVVGDHLILSNAFDYTKMAVYNRFTGEYLGDDLVNTSTLATEELTDNMQFWAIASDDAGHLVAATYVDTRSDTENGTVRIFGWPDGIDAPPVSKEWAGFWHWGTGAAWAFSNLKVAGDVTGNAVIGTSASSGRAVFATIRDGANVATRFSTQIHEGSSWWSSNVIPTSGEATGVDDVQFISVSGNFRQYISYAPGAIFALKDVNTAGYWYMGGGQYQRNAIGGDWIQAEDHCLLGVMNGWYAGSADPYTNNQFYYQLVVSDITAVPGENSFTDGLIFASRSSENDNIREGMGYGVQGMLSPFAFENGQTVLGPNSFAPNKNQFGDVVMAKSSEKRIQVYAMAMNLGVIAYEISYY